MNNQRWMWASLCAFLIAFSDPSCADSELRILAVYNDDVYDVDQLEEYTLKFSDYWPSTTGITLNILPNALPLNLTFPNGSSQDAIDYALGVGVPGPAVAPRDAVNADIVVVYVGQDFDDENCGIAHVPTGSAPGHAEDRFIAVVSDACLIK